MSKVFSSHIIKDLYWLFWPAPQKNFTFFALRIFPRFSYPCFVFGTSHKGLLYSFNKRVTNFDLQMNA